MSLQVSSFGIHMQYKKQLAALAIKEERDADKEATVVIVLIPQVVSQYPLKSES